MVPEGPATVPGLQTVAEDLRCAGLPEAGLGFSGFGGFVFPLRLGFPKQDQARSSLCFLRFPLIFLEARCLECLAFGVAQWAQDWFGDFLEK